MAFNERIKQVIQIMIVPPNDTKTINLRISLWKIYLAGGILTIFFLMIIYFLANYGNLLRKATRIDYLIVENKRLVEENKRVNYLANELEKLEKFAKQINQIATSQVDDSYRISQAELDKITQNEEKFSFASDLLKSKKGGQDEFSSLVQKQKFLMETIPSINPVEKGWFSQFFSERHKALDIAAPMFTPVRAAASGEVTFAGGYEDFGNYLIIDHKNGYKTKYGHNYRFTVKIGDYVSQGDIIAFVGNSGNSSAPHLHYEVWKDGKPLDPMQFIKNIENK